MIKFFLGIAIVAFGSFCGYLLAKKYRQRKQFFKQFHEFNQRFLSEIAYYRRPVRDFVQAYAYEGEFQLLLSDYFAWIEERGEGSFVKKESVPFLLDEEKRTVEDYFFMLGKGDSGAQRGYFSSVQSKLSSMQTEAETTAKRYGDLYVKLGFLCGLLVLILIV